GSLERSPQLEQQTEPDIFFHAEREPERACEQSREPNEKTKKGHFPEARHQKTSRKSYSLSGSTFVDVIIHFHHFREEG
ncbi:MAG TPA: hypothetical protein VF827_02065, partial [Syntrophales bacterium]